jgi:hypothetical protein
MERAEELSLFSQSFDQSQMQAVYQWIKRFGWSPEDEQKIKELIDHTIERMRLSAEAKGRRTAHGGLSAAEIAQKRFENRQGTVVREHECGGKITEYAMPICERTLTGRKTYRECDKCTWYSEVFLKTTEIEYEGG